MRDIKGFANHRIPKLPHVNRTPAERLAFFRALGIVQCGRNWRDVRECMSAPDPLFYPGSVIVGENTSWEKRHPVMVAWEEGHFREHWADEIDGTYIDHEGWYADADCSSMYRAFVFELPHGRFGAGYAVTDTGERVYFLHVYTEVKDAASEGDSMARYFAGQEREYNERWQAAREKHESLDGLETNVARLFALRNHPTLGDTARTDIVDAIDALREVRVELATTYKDIEF